MENFIKSKEFKDKFVFFAHLVIETILYKGKIFFQLILYLHRRNSESGLLKRRGARVVE